jgi:hypothetical protein
LSHYPTISDVLNSPCGSRNQHLVEANGVVKKKSKFNNNKCIVDDKEFDSEKEANYYKKLKILLKAGKIGFLELQVPYELNPGGTHSLKYIADFVFVDRETGEKHVVDVKGFRTVIYRKKRRLMKKVHGIKIIEI